MFIDPSILRKISLAAAAIVCAGMSSHLQNVSSTHDDKADGTGHANADLPPSARIIEAGLGAFRGIAAEFVWFRTERLQDLGDARELAQLYSALSFLEPETPEVWIYAAWNLAYNVGAMMPTAQDRWNWLSAAIRLLRDDALSFNPSSAEIRSELAWTILHKIVLKSDQAGRFYEERWKEMMQSAITSGDFSGLRMSPDLMRAAEQEFGSLDWTDPASSAIYWACDGLRYAKSKQRREKLVSIVNFSLDAMRRKKKARN